MAPTDEDPAFVVIREAFGGDEVVLLRAESFQLSDKAAVDWLAGLSERFKKMPAVADCIDPFHFPGIAKTDPVEALRAAAQRPAVIELRLCTIDPPRADYVLRIRADAPQKDCVALAHDVGKIGDEAAKIGIKTLAGGHPLVAAALDDEARRVENVFSPLLAVAAVLGITLSLRSFLLAGITVLPAALASTGVRAAMRWIDWPANLILVSAGPITFVIVLAATLHVVTTFRRIYSEGGTAAEAVRATLKEKLVAGILSGITTGIGLSAFAFSEVEPVRRLGISTAIAVSLATFLEYGLVPVMLVGFARRRPKARKDAHYLWRRNAARSVRFRIPIIVATTILIVLGAIAPSYLAHGTNALDYFPHGHPVRDQFLELEKSGGAMTTVEVIARRNDKKSWFPAALADGKTDQAILAARGALDVVGPEIVAKDVRGSASFGSGMLLGSGMRQSGRLDQKSEWAHWTVRIPTLGAAETLEVRDRIAEAAKKSPLLAGAEVHVTGSILRILEVQTHLVGTLWSSLGLTLVVTAGLFFLVIRSFRELVAALLANLLPVGVVLIAPWVLGWQLDAATVMTASVVLGLAYNTFHLLQGAGPLPKRRRLRAGLGSFHRVGHPAAVSYLVLALGFSVLLLSGFAPTSRFGFLTALGVLFALIGDLFVLPAVWLKKERTIASGGKP